MPPRRLLLSITLLLAAPLAARGQAVPFFFPGAGAYEPEIAIVQSGVVNDVQANVGPDARYVTLTMNSASAQLQSLSTFAFQESDGVGFGGVGGFVGNVRFKAGSVQGAVHFVGDTRLGNGSGAVILGQHGMTHIVGR